MAKKKSGVNKSQAIRDYLKAKPEAGPTEVVAEMKKKNIKITPALVSNVKKAMNGGKSTGKGAKRGPKPGRRAADQLSINDLLTAKEFADSVGGVDQAVAVLKALDKLG